jgi:uncharacterized membrane protein (UPF0127 family)
MRPASPLLALGALILALVLAHAADKPVNAQDGPQPRLLTTPLTITTSSGEHRFTVEMAVTPEQSARGLMFREQLAPNEGMLFDFHRDQIVTMWMRNTILSLDMIFISREGQVATIAERTTPFSESVISSRVRVRAVLEVPAGTAQRLGIRPGDRVRNAMFGNAP